ncbi:hypothetical protein FISHEDRAFT_65796 [Fistulina hepatica ATCC 64428]|uniref:F-box domain-containing protein n=1 Tax=Fistulina hepatica ATCC 64428 TaxID=1128425 RepID=A0A0D7AEF2_9AGAR|nr:hypothetical protein FISHEDRAFT_65796 [Fistulina hepatica ATCC 64428]
MAICLIGLEVLYEYVWISKAAEARRFARLLEHQACDGHGSTVGVLMRKLHIETNTFERCDPKDLRIILDHAPLLVDYSDHHSVRRNLLEEIQDPTIAPDELLRALARPNNVIKRLTWTNYDDLCFHSHLTPALQPTMHTLEYLELTFLYNDSPLKVLDDLSGECLVFSALKSLKVTLDNATFTVLSTWQLPVLRNLSVVSADFSYASSGFATFFRVHGPSVKQLELGHSSAVIEEHYLAHRENGQGAIDLLRNGILAEWCPNLEEFVCSADAEWNWHDPDWIAPHLLLRFHPRVKLIAVRDLDKRLRDDLELARTNRHFANVGSDADGLDGEQVFFRVLEQMSSLLRKQAFPQLKFIRDMSYGSECMRCSPATYGNGHDGILCLRDRRRILNFWAAILMRCQGSGVWLEGCEGVNVTIQNLRRAGHVILLAQQRQRSMLL